MADREVGDALAGSFLAELPAEVVSELVASGERADYPAGTTIYQPGSEPQTVLVVRGLLRSFLLSPEGRQLTYRYTRPRLYENLEQAAVNAFGSVRQRVAAHLLDLASARQEPAGRLAARISQQELADAVGSVREVVARVLRELRIAGVIATAADHIVILDAARLHAESAGSARA